MRYCAADMQVTGVAGWLDEVPGPAVSCRARASLVLGPRIFIWLWPSWEVAMYFWFLRGVLGAAESW